MVDITDELEVVEYGVYGDEIRGAIHDALEKLSEATGGTTLITKSITENGTYNAEDDNADGYSSVTVNVAEYQQILDDTIEAILETFNINLSEYSEIPDTIKKQATTSLETTIGHGIEVDYNNVSYTSLSTLPVTTEQWDIASGITFTNYAYDMGTVLSHTPITIISATAYGYNVEDQTTRVEYGVNIDKEQQKIVLHQNNGTYINNHIEVTYNYEEE